MTTPTYDGSTPLDLSNQKIGCRITIGHGESCVPGWLCDACEWKKKAMSRIRYLEAELAKAQPKEPPKPPKPFRITGQGSHYSRDGVESEVEVSPCGDMQYPWLVTTENRCYSVDDFGYKIAQSFPDPLDIVSLCENQEGEG